MKYILVLMAIAWSDFDLNRIANINKLKDEAQTAYLNEDYQTAIQKYLLLTDSLKVNDENVILNLSNAYFQLNDTLNAQSSYQKLVNSPNREVRSRAFQQLGVMAEQKSQLPVALDMFKESLKANPGNEEARYNYELVKKKLENQPQQEQQNKDQEDQKDQDQEKEENQEQEQDQSQNQDQNQDQPNQEQQQPSDQQDQQDQQEQQQGQENNSTC